MKWLLETKETIGDFTRFGSKRNLVTSVFSFFFKQAILVSMHLLKRNDNFLQRKP